MIIRAMLVTALLATVLLVTACPLPAEPPVKLKRCELIPLARSQVSFRVDGIEKTRWHFAKLERPFFFPFNGPSGTSLTRMGHPGAPNHDHHRSVWFGHKDVNGVDFWANNTGALLHQVHWNAYRDGDEECVMATEMGWYDKKQSLLMNQQLVAALRPLEHGEYELELQITLSAPRELKPPFAARSVKLGRTNFGFLAVRVAKSVSAHFGGGQITNSEGQIGEPAIFGKQARWMDYSGHVSQGTGAERKSVIEGITYFDHPSNPRYPTHWHVREDGWMGASFCLKDGYKITGDSPLKDEASANTPATKSLVLRYLLHSHAGAYDHGQATAVQKAFAQRPGFVVRKSSRKHRQFEVERRPNSKS